MFRESAGTGETVVLFDKQIDKQKTNRDRCLDTFDVRAFYNHVKMHALTYYVLQKKQLSSG